MGGGEKVYGSKSTIETIVPLIFCARDSIVAFPGWIDLLTYELLLLRCFHPPQALASAYTSHLAWWGELQAASRVTGIRDEERAVRRVAELVTSAVKIQVPASERVVNVILSEKNGLCNDSGVMLKKTWEY